jgi:Iron-containing redox enzyme
MLDVVRVPTVDYERDLQFTLNRLNSLRLNPTLPTPHWEKHLAEIARLSIFEGKFLEDGRQAIAERAATAPTDPDGFIEWFEALREHGPGQNDRLFPWLATQCSMGEMKWFLTQEVAGEAGFEDLTALTQIKLPTRPKLELARNYWDEMGRGNPKAMHGPLLSALAKHLHLNPLPETTVTEALALANTMAGLAANRRYAYQSIGALGVIEMTAPGRSAATSAGLKRLGVRAGDRHYFALHAILDIKHSLAWNSEAIKPLISESPEVAIAIAEGALMRLECGARCFRRYRSEFGLQ